MIYGDNLLYGILEILVYLLLIIKVIFFVFKRWVVVCSIMNGILEYLY